MNQDILESAIKGSIIGLLVGDALGFPYSGRKISHSKIDMIEGKNGEPAGSFQGPGALTLCTMSSIVEYGTIDTSDIIEKFNDFMIGGYMASTEDCSDISPATIAAIKNYNNGMPPDKCASKDEIDDNECLTRILPIALFCSNGSLDNLVDKSHEVCRITHAQTKSQVVCALFCLIVRNLLIQHSEKVFDLLKDYYVTKKMNDYTIELDKFKEYKNTIKYTPNSTSVEDCFWNAWMAYAKYENNFKDCVSFAIASSGDPNSAGAVAGSLSGLVNGLSSIPNKWLQKLYLTQETMEVINKFTNLVKNKFSS